MPRTSLNKRVDEIPDPGEIEFDCLKIKPLDKKALNESSNFSDNVVLKHPFFSIFLGPSRSGKTTTWINLLKNPSMLYKKFEQVYYFIPTWDDDDIYTQNLETEDEFVIKDYSPHIFEAILKSRENLIEAHKKAKGVDAPMDGVLPPTLFIVDDNIGNRFLSARMYSMLDVLATRGRKFNISVIVTIQFMRNIASTVVRGNATDLFIFFIPNAEEQKKVLMEFQGSVEQEDIIKMYRSCFKKEEDKYNFFYIANFITNNRIKFRKNLNTILLPPSTLEENRSKKLMGCSSCSASRTSRSFINGSPAVSNSKRGSPSYMQTKTGKYLMGSQGQTRI
jgi:Poxvirus A32 protein